MRRVVILAFLLSGITQTSWAELPSRAPAGYTKGLEGLGLRGLLQADSSLPAKSGNLTAQDGQSVGFKNAMSIWPSQARLLIGSGGVGASYTWSFGGG